MLSWAGHFFAKYQVGIFPGEKLLKFPDITLLLNEIKKDGTRRKIHSKTKIVAQTTQKVTIKPKSQEFFNLKLSRHDKKFEGMTGMVLPDVQFEGKHDLCLSSCLTTIATNNELQILALNLTDHVVTVSKKSTSRKVPDSNSR